MTNVDEKEINSHYATNPLGAWLNAVERSNNDFYLYESEFTDCTYVNRLTQIKDLAEKFFNQKVDYINYRGNRGKPFTALKFTNIKFPNNLTTTQKDSTFYYPMKQLNVTLKPTKTNGYVIRVYC